MNMITMNIVGVMTFWHCAVLSNRDRIAAQLKELGFGDCAPPKRSHISAASVALDDCLKHHKGVIVRKLDDNLGVVAMKEKKGTTKNEYEPIAYIHCIEDDKGVAQIVDIGLHGITEESERIAIRSGIYSRFESALTECDSSQLGAGMAKVVRKLSGTTMRESGGVYWVPEYSLETYRKAIEIFEGNAIKGTTKVYQVTIAKDDSSIEAVHDAIMEDIKTRVAEISEEIIPKDGRRTPRKDMVKARGAGLSQMLDRLKGYETLLSEDLSELKTAIFEAAKLNTAVQLTQSADLFAGIDAVDFGVQIQ